jgi:DNA (cytosine-5)-methyltransferase 1
MRFLSVCSGIEAASVASAHLGWEAVGLAEIDPFCCSLLAEKYPTVRNYGDFTTIRGDELGPVDAIVGGTPCQDFSVAGKRAGLDGARGNLTLEFVRLVERVSPRWVFWENVPGVLSIDGGRAFGAFLGALGQLGYGIAYRVLDAQYFGLAQRRKRVFVVGCLGNWRHSASVLLEPDSVQGTTFQGRQERESDSLGITFCPSIGGTLDKGIPGRSGSQAGYFDHLIALDWQSGGDVRLNCSSTHTSALQAHQTPAVLHGGVRRLTPRECERLQGFPDDYTLITHRGKPAADGPRYKALGNSWAVPCVRWIFERMDYVDSIMSTAR